MNRVMVRVRGTQKDAAGEQQVIETTSEGTYAFRSGKHYIRYVDCSLSQEKSTSTVLKFTKDSLLLLRKGAVDSEQQFIAGQETHSIYRTPYGNLNLSAATDRLSVVFDAVQGGQITVGYALAVNGAFQSDNTLQIEIVKIASGKQ